jgi:hypothetical protein
MQYVYLLYHEVYIVEEPEKDEELFVGIYSEEDKALEALRKFKKLKRFELHKEGFGISRIKINKDHWCEGYVSG